MDARFEYQAVAKKKKAPSSSTTIVMIIAYWRALKSTSTVAGSKWVVVLQLSDGRVSVMEKSPGVRVDNVVLTIMSRTAGMAAVELEKAVFKTSEI